MEEWELLEQNVIVGFVFFLARCAGFEMSLKFLVFLLVELAYKFESCQLFKPFVRTKMRI